MSGRIKQTESNPTAIKPNQAKSKCRLITVDKNNLSKPRYEARQDLIQFDFRDL